MKQLVSPRRTPVSQCVEVATFRLKAGVTDDVLLAVEGRARRGRIREMPGYIGRELAKDEGAAEWMMVLRFDTRDQMDAWMREVKSVPEMREMGGLIEPGTMTTRFFARVEPPT
jgi:antibiotic biosynthesis monooxygenase (ABM) superfamily enzyme